MRSKDVVKQNMTKSGPGLPDQETETQRGQSALPKGS